MVSDGGLVMLRGHRAYEQVAGVLVGSVQAQMQVSATDLFCTCRYLTWSQWAITSTITSPK